MELSLSHLINKTVLLKWTRDIKELIVNVLEILTLQAFNLFNQFLAW